MAVPSDSGRAEKRSEDSYRDFPPSAHLLPGNRFLGKLHGPQNHIRASLLLAVVCQIFLDACGSGNRPIESGSRARFASAPALRRIYRYSVIPGGVISADELRGARRIDRVVAAHYYDFESS